MLKPVGFYSDTEAGEFGQPTLAESRGTFDGSAPEVVEYLRNAHCFILSGSAAYDELDPARPVIGPFGLQTDGVWFWPSSYPYYVERYRVDVPEDLLDLARKRDWIAPEFPDDVDFEERIPFGD
jgi:hypothetical protein